MNRTEGDINLLDGRGDFSLKGWSADDLLNLHCGCEYGERDRARTKNQYHGGTNYENNLTRRWFFDAQLRLEHDESEGIDERVTVRAGTCH